MDSSMNNLLKWSIENSTASNQNSDAPAAPSRPIDAEALQRLLGNTPSDAELMKAAMSAIKSPDVSLENKLIAFDNFEQLIENLDNANNMEVLGLWSPLVDELSVDEAERRKMAAWCLGTAVQNNEKAQERLLVVNPLPVLLRLSREDPDTAVRRKAVYAISSAVRNYQPAFDELRKLLGLSDKADAGDMEQVDAVITPLRNA